MKKDWLRKYDLLKVTTSLSYKNEYFYSTNIGAILTIFLFLMILSVILYEIMILYKKASFTLIYNQYIEFTQIIDFSQTPFLFQLTNDYGQYFDIYNNKLFEIEAYDFEMTLSTEEDGFKGKKLISNKLELEKCDKILSNLSEYSELNLSRYICIKPGQNLTSYGLLGDINNPFKGIRIYINKCRSSNCYNTSEIAKKLNNAKFLVTFLSLSSDIFHLNNENIKYQLFTKYFSLSTTILKKIVFTYDIGRFYLNNNIFYKNNISFNYIIGNDYSIDVDLDHSSTIKNDEYTLAYISLGYGGKVIEIRKNVQNIFDSLSNIGNLFNIILTLFKIINNYYSNKILFVDIFKSVFFDKETMNINFRENNYLINRKNLNKNNNINNKKNLDISDEICFKNNNINKIKSVKSLSNKKILITRSNSIVRRKSKTYAENRNKESIKKNKLMLFYILPFWFLRKNKKFDYIYLIKDRICGYFSIEKLNDLIKFKEFFFDKSKIKINNTDIIKFHNNNSFEKNCPNDI